MFDNDTNGTYKIQILKLFKYYLYKKSFYSNSKKYGL